MAQGPDLEVLEEYTMGHRFQLDRCHSFRMPEFALGWMRQGSEWRNDRGLYHSVVRTSAPSGTDGG